jgi:malic enzyme
MLDVGTNNPQHLEDPLYMGWRHPRISDEQYLEFMDMFVHAVQQRWPNVLLQFEDFAQKMPRDCSTAIDTSCAVSTMIFRAPPP